MDEDGLLRERGFLSVGHLLPSSPGPYSLAHLNFAHLSHAVLIASSIVCADSCRHAFP